MLPGQLVTCTMNTDTRTPQKLPFCINNAFTDRLEGGNPAAIVHLPSLTALPDATLQTIARNFNQPMTVFIAPQLHQGSAVNQPTSPKMRSRIARFGIRWFTPEVEMALCGHGTLAAAATVFRDTDDADAEDVTEIRFEATSGKFLVARKVEKERIDLDLDSETTEKLSTEEDIKLRGVVAKALGKNVPVKYTGRGAGHLKQYALIEVDTLELKNIKVNTDAFFESTFMVHVVIAPSSLSDVTFESRMFAPSAGIPEDPVCGTAHTLSTPYLLDDRKQHPRFGRRPRKAGQRSWG